MAGERDQLDALIHSIEGELALSDQISIGGLVLHIENSKRAKRIQIKVDGRTGKSRLIVPLSATRKKAIEFARSREDWLRKQSALTPESVPFSDGMILPFKGRDHRVVNVPGRRGVAIHEVDGTPEILIPGQAEHLPRRLTDWLKKNLKADMEIRSQEKAARVNKTISRLSVRDTVSRWGSCSSKGALSFSWRLIFAPDTVRDYMAAHECAHLVHMNHSNRFWALCEELTDLDTVAASETYLRQNARFLFSFGRND